MRLPFIIDSNGLFRKQQNVKLCYRWSGYGEACGGGKAARAGLMAVQDPRHYGQSGAWRHVSTRCRVRYFTDGMAVGGREFVERIFNDNRALFGPKRKDGARKMRFGAWGGLRTVRALRVDAVRPPLTT